MHLFPALICVGVRNPTWKIFRVKSGTGGRDATKRVEDPALYT